MIILFIDDQESRHIIVEEILGKKHQVLHAYNFEEAIEAFEASNQKIGLACFDHDLGDIRKENGEEVEYTGSKLVSHLILNIEESKWPTRAISHSSNYSAALNVASKLRSAGIHTETMAYSSKMIENLAESLKEN